MRRKVQEYMSKKKGKEAYDWWSRERAKPLQGKLGAAQRYTMGKTPLEGAEGSLGRYKKRTPGNRIILRRPGDIWPFICSFLSKTLASLVALFAVW